jgi:uncharacterized protein YndB with AHSA1/START domain
MADSFTFKTTYVVYASPKEVFEALTDSGLIAAWGGGISVVENQVGGHFEWFDGDVEGEVTAFVPEQELGFSWKPVEWSKSIKPSQVNIKLKIHSAGTDVVLIHTDFPSQDIADRSGNGWIDFVLDPLNDYFVTQKEFKQS